MMNVDTDKIDFIVKLHPIHEYGPLYDSSITTSVTTYEKEYLDG